MASFVVVVVILGAFGALPRGMGAMSSEAKEFLAAHNEARARVGVGALEWSPELAAYAQRYGEGQRDQHECAMVHSQGEYGENLFWGYGKKFTPSDAVGSWEKENRDYDYESNSCARGKVCGHYTQLVWADTERVGCASIACNDGATFIICSYDPPGNFVGESPYKRSGSGSGSKPREDRSSNLASATESHDGDDAEDFNQLDARLCQCMMNCVSKSAQKSTHHHHHSRQ